ncbi:MAG TPA: hypothetical protein VF006_08095 [Longimicrobium sp.]
MSGAATGVAGGVPARLWAYQRERFPLAAYLPLITLSALSAAAWSRAARGRPGLPGAGVLLVGCATALAFFFLLRVADEHKDAEADRRFRPELPVPRGLVSLAELRRVGGALAAAALLANALAAPALLWALLAAAAWAALMAREFFAPAWLRARPAAYLLSHMGAMPLLFAYLTGLDWLASGAAPPRALAAFLGLAFMNGILIEVGRKIRAPGDERAGVDTYTSSWGLRAAPAVWAAALVLAAVLAWCAARATGSGTVTAAALAVLLPAAAFPALRFLRTPTRAGGRHIEAASGVWTLASYAVLGFAPLLVR